MNKYTEVLDNDGGFFGKMRSKKPKSQSKEKNDVAAHEQNGAIKKRKDEFLDETKNDEQALKKKKEKKLPAAKVEDVVEPSVDRAEPRPKKAKHHHAQQPVKAKQPTIPQQIQSLLPHSVNRIIGYKSNQD